MKWWITTAIALSALLLGGGLLGAPIKVAEWMESIAEKEVEAELRPVIVELKNIGRQLNVHSQLLKEIRDREINRNDRKGP